ncbi:MAG: hypothetical protein GTO00_09245 [Deltaproteobacteria bacterium]|nr:hypothetical protein [Deltaproteobacteria bacterium]
MEDRALLIEERIQLLEATAKHFEEHPKLYSFMRTGVPVNGTIPCCPLGYMGVLLNKELPPDSEDRFSTWKVANILYGNDQGSSLRFYTDMDTMVGKPDWVADPSLMVSGLRLLAESWRAEL